MSDIDLSKLFDDAFSACQVQHDDGFFAMSLTRARYARLIGAQEHIIKTLVRSNADRRMVRDILEGLAYDATSKGE